jgi:uncharacterized protein (TIGR02145 family)
MKKITLFLLLGVFLWQSFAQVPQKFSYQAAIRNGEGIAIANEDVDIKISLRKLTTDGEIVYSENHLVTTSPQGIVSLSVGAGNLLAGDFLLIPWNNEIYIQVDFRLADEKGEYVTLGISQILAVPYSLYAGNAIQGEGVEGFIAAYDGANWASTNQINLSVNSVEIKAMDDRDQEEPIFKVLNSNNEIVFAVYESGVKINIAEEPNSGKGNKGGFAIGGLTGMKETTETTDYLTILPDSVRFNIIENNEQGKGNKGGFAIGGLTGQKYTPVDLLSVNIDTTTIYTTLQATGNVDILGNIYTGGTISTQVTYNGYTYQTIQIGSQTWFKENLQTLNYHDGEPINPLNEVFDYELEPANRPVHGLLYAQSVIMSANGLCPIGWHVPNMGDWDILFNWLGGEMWFENYDLIAIRLMEVGSWDEAPGDLTPNNISGFSARPGGRGALDIPDPIFFDINQKAFFWTSGDGIGTFAYAYEISKNSGTSIVPISEVSGNELFYVRCIKDNY